MFSRNGSYFAELFDAGFYLYGGTKKLNFFAHRNVSNLEFSYNEEYILSFNGTVSENESNGIENFIVWNVA